MKISYPSDIPLLRWTLIALALACSWVIFRSILRLLDGDYLPGVLGIAFWLLLAAGLWIRLALARWVALMILWALVIVIPLGTINPFYAMDIPSPPPVWELLLFQVVPWVVPSLFAIHVLGKFKNAFRWRPETAA